MKPALSWYLAAQAIGCELDQIPLPPGINEAVVGDWLLVANNSKLELVYTRVGLGEIELPAFEIYCEHQIRLSFGLLAPTGGLIGGYTEDQFIEDMVKHLPAEIIAPVADDLAYRKETMQ